MSWRPLKSRINFNSLGPWIALTLLGLIAGAPLLSATHVTGGYDTSFHLWRAVQAERLLRHGWLWSRWAPDMARGFGYPLFVFQGQLSAQIAAVGHLVGLNWTTALNATYLLGLIGSAWAVFLLARALWGEGSPGDLGGWGAAALFLFAPYHLYVVYFRGSLAETVAWIFPPLVLWGVTRWVEDKSCKGLIVGAGALAALAMTHPVSLYLFAPLFVVWAGAEALGEARDRAGWWRALGRAGLLLGLGLALGAFAWLPGLIERDYVQLGRATGSWVFDYRENFLPLSHLLALPRVADPRLINDWPARGVGGLFVVAALLGWAAWPLHPRRGRIRLMALGASALGYLWLSTALSRPLWDALPILAAFQFPWRFLAPATLALVLLIGGGLRALCRSEYHSNLRGRWATLAVIVALVVAHWGWLYPPLGRLPAPADVAGMIQWERATDTVGTTAGNELAPRWMQSLPDWEHPAPVALRARETPARLDAASLPAGAQILAASYRLMSGEVTITTPEAFRARWFVHYYPGWRVEIDGARVEAGPDPATGWLAFDVPAGAHTVRVAFGETPWRIAADALSALALASLGVALGRSPARREESAATSDLQKSPARWAIHLALLALALMGLKFLVADRYPVLWRSTRWQADGSLRGVAPPRDVRFGEQAVLLGIEPLPVAVAGDAAPTLTLYWRAINPAAREWRVGVRLVGPEGFSWAVGVRPVRWGREPPPLAEWPRDRYARMDYVLDLPAGLPPGVYEVRLSLFDRETLTPASVKDAAGHPQGPDLALGAITVMRPQRPPSLAALDVPAEATPQACEPLRLWSFTADRMQAAPGDLVVLRAVWEARAALPADQGEALSMTLTLNQSDLFVARARYEMKWSAELPVEKWRVGERWVGKTSVRLPGSLHSGDYRLAVSLPSCPNLAFAPLTVVAPERRWTVPDDFISPGPDVSLGESVRLVGYRIEPEEGVPGGQVVPGGRVTVHLAWESRAEMTVSYHVFVHVLDDAGQIIAQNDGEPVGWTRPTTGWAIGEIVLEERRLHLLEGTPPGRYRVRVGMYEVDGPRLVTPAGADGITLGEIEVLE
ncbi:MAG: hypothetical protein ACLFTI_09525 [Anaerolineales bacterium]